MTKKYLVTTAIDYANAVIHIGHAYEKVLADCYVRHLRLLHGDDAVYFVTGTDEHGQKVERAASNAGLTPQEFANQVSEGNKKELEKLDISFNRFIRTTDPDHIKEVESFWELVKNAGFIYEGEYSGLYCEGDEAFVTPSELIDGKCPNHPTTELKTVSERNYFFKWEEFTGFLGDYITKHHDFLPQEIRKNEMLKFLAGGLRDLTISRQKEAVSWGIPVPNDPDQVMYVWFDALINYLTAGSEVGFWDDHTRITHFVGKDILRWHALLWPAMLSAGGYTLPHTIVAHGFLSLNGQKISKSVGNVITPSELVDKYGVDATRYYLLRYTRLDSDSDINLEHLEEVYNADLANSLGNLVSRVAKLCETYNIENTTEIPTYQSIVEGRAEYTTAMDRFAYGEAGEVIFWLITQANQELSEKAPWTLAKEEGKEKEVHEILTDQIGVILEIATLLTPFMPQAAEKIIAQFSQPHITAGEPLFPRLEK